MELSESEFPWSSIYDVEKLAKNKPTYYSISPDAKLRRTIADDLGLDGLLKLSFKGDIRPLGETGWAVQAQLGATIVQPCVATLEPVKTRIDGRVAQNFVAEQQTDETHAEQEIPEDVTQETLGKIIDVGDIMVEALLLRLPLFPRASGVEPVNITVTEPGIAPMTPQDARPFAQLKSLRDKLSKPSE